MQHYNYFINFYNIIHYLYNLKPLWNLLKSMIVRLMGSYSNTFTLSLARLSVLNLKYLISNEHNRFKPAKYLFDYNIIYLKCIPTLNFSNLNFLYNIITFHLMYFILSQYPAITYYFKSWYAFVLLQPISYLYNLQSKFFFQIRHF